MSAPIEVLTAEVNRLRAWGARWKRAAGLLKMRADLFASLATGHATRAGAQAECDRANAPMRRPARCSVCGFRGHRKGSPKCLSRPDAPTRPISRDAAVAACNGQAKP